MYAFSLYQFDVRCATDSPYLSFNCIQCHNALASLPDGVFNNNTALEKVYLADNALASLPDGIFDNTAKLKTVDLRNNELATLPRDLFPHGEPGKLYLSGNPGHPFTFD